jgi:UDP-N-acetylglucosamine--N-acetylmuramyl-(pentapeptide) pyrophosphoryl-undecaprenol N-acetylglucosamine transferase
MAMKFIVACGGTGGHSFPGLAVARELKDRGHNVTVWMSGRNIESSVLKSWDGDVFFTGMRQLSLKNVFRILLSLWKCKREIVRAKPDALLAMGSYSSLPPVLAAYSSKVPVVLHEANTVPGKAVSFLSRFAKTVATSFDITKNFLPDRETVKTGLPVRAGIGDGKRFEEIPEGSFVLFVTGGSQGAHRVNELVSSACVIVKKTLDKKESETPFFVIHQTGAADEKTVKDKYAHANVKCRVNAFEYEMADAFKSANLVVARAGASTCFELAAAGKPAFFIPLPSALRDHQHVNALAFVQNGAADEGIQDKLTPEVIADFILYRIEHPSILEEKAEKMKAMSIPDAAGKVADILEGIGK